MLWTRSPARTDVVTRSGWQWGVSSALETQGGVHCRTEEVRAAADITSIVSAGVVIVGTDRSLCGRTIDMDESRGREGGREGEREREKERVADYRLCGHS
jgi:hypothetical protein